MPSPEVPPHALGLGHSFCHVGLRHASGNPDVAHAYVVYPVMDAVCKVLLSFMLFFFFFFLFALKFFTNFTEFFYFMPFFFFFFSFLSRFFHIFQTFFMALPAERVLRKLGQIIFSNAPFVVC